MRCSLFDSHTHSDNSPDGFHSVLYLCESALQQGLKGFALTDHVECHDMQEYGYEQRLRQSVFELERARQLFEGRLVLAAGVELGQPTQNLPAAEAILDGYPFDFVLGSLHNSRGRPDAYFVNFNDPQVCVRDELEVYYKEYIELAKWNRFDSLAHLTYPIRYIWGKYRIPVDFSAYSDYIDELFRLLAQNGRGLEINTSGMRQGLGFTLPALELIKRFRQLGGEIITLGSDAHYGEHLGADFAYAIHMLREAGFKRYAFFLKRQPIFLEIT